MDAGAAISMNFLQVGGRLGLVGWKVGQVFNLSACWVAWVVDRLKTCPTLGRPFQFSSSPLGRERWPQRSEWQDGGLRLTPRRIEAIAHAVRVSRPPYDQKSGGGFLPIRIAFTE